VTAKGIGLRKSHRVVLAALTLASVAGVQLATVAASSSTTVTNPASAKVVNGRFTTTVVLDGGLITVTPAPASVQSQQGIGGMTAKIWATTQLLNFQPQTLGYGIVTVHGTSKTALPIKNLRAWVGFANGNSSACIKKGGSYRSNGEAFVVVGDEKGSAAAVYVPPGCGITRLSGIRVPSEQSSIKWYKEGSASAKGAVTFRATVPHCATYGASTVIDGTGALKVSILAQRPDQSSLTCVPDVVKLSITLAKTAAKANALRLIQAPIGPVREVTGR
jgi:putative hemolysin